jgi:hypothetical protein
MEESKNLYNIGIPDDQTGSGYLVFLHLAD